MPDTYIVTNKLFQEYSVSLFYLILSLPVPNSAGFWKFTVDDKSQCIIPPGNATGDVQSCTIFFSVCHPIEDNTLCPGENSSICQEVVLNDGTKNYYNLGTYDPSHKYLVSG